MDVDKYQKKQDVFEDLQTCKQQESVLTWEKLETFKNPKAYSDYLDKLCTNPEKIFNERKHRYELKYPSFIQIYFNAGDPLQFERYGYMMSRVLSYPKRRRKTEYATSVYNGNNYETTYDTFRYLFDKLKKGVYVAIRNGELSVFLPFSNAHYINNWSEIVKQSNPQLVQKMLQEKVWSHQKRKTTNEYKNVNDLSRWYANNCIFKGDKMRFGYGDKPLMFIQEGDKTLVPFKHFLLEYLSYQKQSKQKVKDVEFFFNPRDFPVLRQGHMEPYEQIFGDREVEREYRYKTYTPILSQSGHIGYHDIAIPTEDDMKRIMKDKIFQEECKSHEQEDYQVDWSKKTKKCVFRGSCTGCGITPETNQRLHAAILSHGYTKDKSLQNEEGENVLDAKLTGWNRKPKMYEGDLGEIDLKQYKGLPVGKKNYMKLSEQCLHKYILNIDGHVKAFRLGNEMRMGSVILLVDSPYTLWFQKQMIPYDISKHTDGATHIPISSDLSDLKTKLEWCITHDKECEQIAQNSLQFYQEHLTRDKTFETFGSLMDDLHQLRKAPKKKKNKKHMNVIVAFRESGNSYRTKQLHVFIQQMHAIFDDKTNLTIYVIEQEGERTDYTELPEDIKQDNTKMAKFNLGRLKNIGFEISSQESADDSHTYYVLSDVDMLPSEGLVESYLEYPKKPIHLGHLGTRYEVSQAQQSKKKGAHTFLGGVVSFTKKDFTEVNGYPNNFWGWGGEDECLNHRLAMKKIAIKVPEYPVIDLEEMSLKQKMETLKKQKAKEMKKWEKVKEDKQSWSQNGVSSLDGSYEILSQKTYGHYENVKHIIVKLHITDADKED